MFSNFVFHFFKNKIRRGKSKTIVGEIPTIDFTFLDFFNSVKIGVLNVQRCKNKLHNDCCILIDDCGLPHGGKGLFVEKKLVEDGFQLIENQYQHLYVR